MTHPEDVHSRVVRGELLREHGLLAHEYCMSSFPEKSRAVYATGNRVRAEIIDGGQLVDLSSVRCVWWRRPLRCVLNDAGTSRFTAFIEEEANDCLEGLLWSQACRWVNEPMANRRASRKIVQLQEAKRLGLQIPKTLISNDPLEVRAFLEGLGKKAIFKRVGTGPSAQTKTTLVSPDIYERLGSVSACPTTFQEYIDARFDMRVVFIGENLWAFAIDSQRGAFPEDCRIDNSVDFSLSQLPGDIERGLRELKDTLGLAFAIIDLRVDKDGIFYFLEVNPAGQFWYLELKTGVPLAKAMAAYLAKEQ